MKKLLSILSLICCLAGYAGAQTVLFSENFETSKTVIPTGWTQQLAAADPTNKGWEFNNKWPGATIAPYIPSHTYYAFIDEYDYNYPTTKQNYDTLYTPSFSCSTSPSVFISLDALMWVNSYYEDATIAVSTDGGKTWATAVDLAPLYPGTLGSNTWANGLTFDISAYAGSQANVMLAFTYNDGVTASGGYPSYGICLDNISVFSPVAYDVSVVQSTTQYLVKTGTATTLTGTMYNWGGTALTSFRLNYTVNGGPVQSDVISASVGLLNAYNFSHSITWTPSTAGSYTIKYWCDQLNGVNADMNHANDTLWAYFTVLDSVQKKMPMFEEFMQASCNPCMYAAPNLDSVLTNNMKYCNPIRYHVNFPGTDYMNDETQGLFVGTRATYYNLTGVPDAKLDGNTDVYPGSVTSLNIQNAASVGSPFKITITACTFNTTTSTYTFTANVKSYANIPEGTYARVILNVDTIKYAADQSTEDPASSFPGTNPESYYQYVVNFPQVAEEMMPNASGTAFTAFTAGQTQTINVTWKQNHPWGSSPKVYTYDSAFPGVHITAFVQDDQSAANTERPNATGSYPTHANSGAFTQHIYQSASAPVSVIAGFEELANGIYFNMYPNPTNSNSNIVFTLDKDQDVNIEVFNMLGEKVYSVDNTKMSAGEHTVVINGESLEQGVYLVRFTAENVTTTKRLIIQR